MNLFDRLVELALQGHEDYAPLRAVVEKELLHQDILREMSAAGYLPRLTFIGGTCLRDCYGSPRLSEDLDFAGGADFRKEELEGMGQHLVRTLKEKYALEVFVSEPQREEGNVDTWKIRVQTRPEAPNLPSQRINIDICSVASHDPRPRMIANSYGIDMGTGGLVIQAESREEILSDKLIALAERPNRVKNRDIWDIAWLRQQGVALLPALLTAKLEDRKIPPDRFGESMRARLAILSTDESAPLDFRGEMARFLPSSLARQALRGEDFWNSALEVLKELWQAYEHR